LLHPVRGLFWKLPALRDLNPFRRGLLDGLGTLAAATAPTAAFMIWLRVRPDPGLLLGVAQIGATFLVAYAVVVSWLVGTSRDRPSAEREERLGSFLGVGFGGLCGVAFAVVLSARTGKVVWTWLDDALLAWTTAAVFVLGVLVVMQPWVVHEWSDENPPPGG
jgi:hypothetical protein